MGNEQSVQNQQNEQYAPPPPSSDRFQFQQQNFLNSNQIDHPSDSTPLDRFRQGYNEDDLNQSLQREAQRPQQYQQPQQQQPQHQQPQQQQQYYPQEYEYYNQGQEQSLEKKEDKDTLVFPRVTLFQKYQHQPRSDDAHSVYQNVEINPELLLKIDRHIAKTDNQLEQMAADERKQNIIEQLGRISYLEERLELLQKELSNQQFHLKFKHKMTLNFQNDFNKLRDETIAHHARISAFETETKMRDLSKIENEIEGREGDIKIKEKEIEELNDEVNFWKSKAKIDEGCVSIITSLKFRTHGLIRENNRLKDILYSDEAYSDIRSVMYDAKQIQLQQEIFEESDNLLKDYYESNHYDNIFEDKKLGNGKNFSTTNTGGSTQKKQNSNQVQQVQNILSDVNYQNSQNTVTTTTTTTKKVKK